MLSGAGMTNTGPSWITGAIGASSAGITGFPPGTAGPQHIGDSTYTTAETDLVGTFTRAAAEPTTTDYSNVNLGGLTLGPGVYNQSTAPTLTGTLTLSGGGIYIFKIGSTLVTATGARVSLVNGAQPCDIFWVVGSSATINPSTTFVGNIMALASIQMLTGATLNGRALARTAAVTLDTNRIIQPSGCVGSFTQSFPTPAYVPPPAGNILPATLGVPWEFINEIPWLLVMAVGAGFGATVLVVSNRRRRRNSA
ncbi:MAG TPA: ice-binding family protein [Candidatus Dormibacteraeota bacterium]|nr:ice-binding family protein [Candidatus Dormibacteraeota bacterium]